MRKIVLTKDEKAMIKSVVIVGLILIFLVVVIVLGILTIQPPTEKTANVLDSISDQGNLKEQYQQPDAETLADKWPMQPPKVEVMSDWSPHAVNLESYRYIKLDGRLVVESRGWLSRNYSFVPEQAAMPK